MNYKIKISVTIEWFALLHRVRKYLGPVLGTEIGYHADNLGGFTGPLSKNAILILSFVERASLYNLVNKANLAHNFS